MNHPIVGMLITAYIDGGHRVARVERMRFPRKGQPAPLLHVRLHGGPASTADGRDWDTICGRYQGPRAVVAVTSVKRVLPGAGEGWVDAEEFFEWSEA